MGAPGAGGLAAEGRGSEVLSTAASLHRAHKRSPKSGRVRVRGSRQGEVAFPRLPGREACPGLAVLPGELSAQVAS